MKLSVLSWNLFHGRDWPPEPALRFRRGRWSRGDVRGRTHLGVNRDLWRAFTDLLCAAQWDIALLQECPPRWLPGFTRECRADGHRVLTSRNRLQAVSWWIARRAPDLIGSSEGGSNCTLSRGGAGEIAEKQEMVLATRPERRVMALTRLASGLQVANLHASTSPRQAERELIAAAERATEFAGNGPLIFGGDLNLRPRETEVYEELAARFGLAAPTAADVIDHILVRGLEVEEPPRAWPDAERDVPDERSGLAIRLSDHAPVSATFQT